MYLVDWRVIRPIVSSPGPLTGRTMSCLAGCLKFRVPGVQLGALIYGVPGARPGAPGVGL